MARFQAQACEVIEDTEQPYQYVCTTPSQGSNQLQKNRTCALEEATELQAIAMQQGKTLQTTQTNIFQIRQSHYENNTLLEGVSQTATATHPLMLRAVCLMRSDQ